MKRIFIVLVFLFLTKLNFGQTSSLIGAWYWSDSAKTSSLFFKEDGIISMHSGNKGDVILTKNLKNGTYVLENNLLTITWSDKKVEKDKIVFLDTNTIQLTFVEAKSNKQKHEFVFRRVRDEEN